MSNLHHNLIKDDFIICSCYVEACFLLYRRSRVPIPPQESKIYSRLCSNRKIQVEIPNAGGNAEFDYKIRKQRDCEGITKLLLTLPVEVREQVLAEVHVRCAEIPIDNNCKPFVECVEVSYSLYFCFHFGTNANRV